jgi:hypothetical protein
MKLIISIISLQLFVFGQFAVAELEGQWDTGKENTIVKIYQKNGIMQGEIVSSGNPKAQPGTNLIKDLKKEGQEWKCKLFAPKRQEWVDATLKRQGDKLNISVKVGLFSNTMDWSFVKPKAP